MPHDLAGVLLCDMHDGLAVLIVMVIDARGMQNCMKYRFFVVIGHLCWWPIWLMDVGRVDPNRNQWPELRQATGGRIRTSLSNCHPYRRLL
jgi:hypothetical protein